MKFLSISLLVLITCCSGFAQERKQLPFAHNNLHTAKTAAATLRLTASYAGYGTSTGTIHNRDSTQYRYSGNRGGDLSNSPKSDTTINYTWEPSINNWRLSRRYVNTYDGADNLITQVYQMWTAGTWQNFSRSIQAYDAANLDTSQINESWNNTTKTWMPASRKKTTYSGLVEVEDYLYWNSTNASYSTPYFRITFTKDTAGNMIRIMGENYSTTTSSYGNNYLYKYTYTAGNKLSSETYDFWDPAGWWLHNIRVFHYFDAGNQYIGNLLQAGANGGMTWVNSDSTYSIPDANGDAVTEQLYTWSTTTNTWTYTARHSNTWSAPAQLSTQLVEDVAAGPSYTNSARHFYFHNSSAQLTRTYDEKWNGSRWAADITTKELRYYYEDYGNGVSVGGTAATSFREIRLYPSPASNSMELTMYLEQPADFRLAITDQSGKVLSQWLDSGSGRYTGRIETAHLPAGIYYLSVQGAGIRSSKAFVVVH